MPDAHLSYDDDGYTHGVLIGANHPKLRICAITTTHRAWCVLELARGDEQSNPPMAYRTTTHGRPRRAKKFRGVTTAAATAYRVTEGREAPAKRRDVEFQWRIKMRCLDENEKISGHGRTDGGHLNCNFQCEFYTRDRVSVMYAHLKTFHVCTESGAAVYISSTAAAGTSCLECVVARRRDVRGEKLAATLT